MTWLTRIPLIGAAAIDKGLVLTQNGNTMDKMTSKMGNIWRFLQPPRGVFFLFGKRGTGKSTWLKEVVPI